MNAAPEVDLREGGPADIDLVMAVMEDSFDPAYGEAWTGPQCAGLLPMSGVWLTLALDGGEPLGFALARIVSDEAELLLLAVRRGAQRRGIGQVLLDRFAESAAAKGARQLHLEVRDGNPAIRLYRDNGYREVGRRRNYYSGGGGELFDALTLKRSAAE
jgi:[ribosomal protein S18]-alanine N-acetyltransferase